MLHDTDNLCVDVGVGISKSADSPNDTREDFGMCFTFYPWIMYCFCTELDTSSFGKRVDAVGSPAKKNFYKKTEASGVSFDQCAAVSWNYFDYLFRAAPTA